MCYNKGLTVRPGSGVAGPVQSPGVQSVHRAAVSSPSAWISTGEPEALLWQPLWQLNGMVPYLQPDDISCPPLWYKLDDISCCLCHWSRNFARTAAGSLVWTARGCWRLQCSLCISSCGAVACIYIFKRFSVYFGHQWFFRYFWWVGSHSCESMHKNSADGVKSAVAADY